MTPNIPRRVGHWLTYLIISLEASGVVIAATNVPVKASIAIGRDGAPITVKPLALTINGKVYDLGMRRAWERDELALGTPMPWPGFKTIVARQVTDTELLGGKIAHGDQLYAGRRTDNRIVWSGVFVARNWRNGARFALPVGKAQYLGKTVPIFDFGMSGSGK